MRYLTILALAGLLAACSLGATTPSEVALPTIGESSPSASASAAMSTAESPVAVACTDAFANIDAQAIIGMGSVDTLTDELDSTIAACSTADEWESAAESALPGLDIPDPRAFIMARCAAVTSLAGLAICAEVGS